LSKVEKEKQRVKSFYPLDLKYLLEVEIKEKKDKVKRKEKPKKVNLSPLKQGNEKEKRERRNER